jgi:hypothetical protein
LFRNSREANEICRKLKEDTSQEDLDVISFKKVYFSVKLQTLLRCVHFEVGFWKDFIPGGPFSQEDMDHLLSNMLDYFYFFRLQLLLYPNDISTAGTSTHSNFRNLLSRKF